MLKDVTIGNENKTSLVALFDSEEIYLADLFLVLPVCKQYLFSSID